MESIKVKLACSFQWCDMPDINTSTSGHICSEAVDDLKATLVAGAVGLSSINFKIPASQVADSFDGSSSSAWNYSFSSRFQEVIQPHRSFQTSPGESFMYEDITLKDKVSGLDVKIRILVNTANTSFISEISDIVKEKLGLQKSHK